MDVLFVKIVWALCVPGILVIFLTQITRNRFVALILAVALMAASVYAGYTSPPLIFIINAASLTIGFVVATQLQQRKNE